MHGPVRSIRDKQAWGKGLGPWPGGFVFIVSFEKKKLKNSHPLKIDCVFGGEYNRAKNVKSGSSASRSAPTPKLLNCVVGSQ